MRFLIALPLLLLTGRQLDSQQLRIPKSCVPDSSEKATLTGVLELRTYPGPPNYEDTTAGDKGETGIYLLLDGYACTPARGDTAGVYSRSDLEWVQLILERADYPKARRQIGKHVSVDGVLGPAETGHHHTLLIFVPTKPLRITLLDP